MPRLTRRSGSPVVCPGCGSDEARVIQRRETFHEPDAQGDFLYEITQCDACGEELLSFEQAEAESRAYAAAVARARGAMTADRIFDLRMRMGKSQTEMEAAFGVGPKTWGRWERGEVVPTGPAVRLMWLAENRAEVFAQLAEAQNPNRKHVMVVGAIEPQGPGEEPVAYRISKPARKAGPFTDGGGEPGGAV